MKVLVSDSLSKTGIAILKGIEGISVTVKTGLKKEDLLSIISEYDILVVRSETDVSAEVISAAKRLKIIGRAGIGVDNIDLDAASKKGIIVMNTPEGNVATTAEHAISMMLALARKIPQASASVKANKWEKKKFTGVEIQNKTLGVIGIGRIGTIVIKKAKGLGMSILAFDPFISKDVAATLNIELADSLPVLLKRADFITVHAPKTENTINLISEAEFNIMKPGVRIINCARGGIVNEKALYDAIKNKKVAGAALDVFEQEPPEGSPLLALEEVICTPHIGASTDEAQENVAIAIAEQIAEYARTGQIKNAVNLPPMDNTMRDKLNPYLTLGENIGRMQAQLIEGGIKDIDILYRGDIAGLDVKYITLSVLKGILAVFIKENINLINAPVIAKERGIRVTESSTNDASDYVSLLVVTVKTDKEKKTIEGTIFGKSEPRIVKIDEYTVEVKPSGNLLVFSNVDAPGVIGKIGTFLGDNSINIADMYLGRAKTKGKALAIVTIDSSLSEKLLKEVASLPNVIFAKLLRL